MSVAAYHQLARRPVRERLIQWLIARTMAIDLGNGTGIASVRKGDGTVFSEVRKGDGTVLFSGDAIPDSAIYRWILDDVDSGTVEDSIGDADGSVNGVSSISSSDYQGGSAGDGDGVDDNIQTTTLGSFGSQMDTDFALSFTIDNFTDSGRSDFGIFDGDSAMYVVIGRSNGGDLGLSLQDQAGDNIWIETDSGSHVDDGTLHRVLFNKVANSGDGAIEVYVADNGDSSYTAVNASAAFDQGFSSPLDFTEPWTLFARKESSGTGNHLDAVKDDVILYNDSLDSSERQADLDDQPAFGA